MKRRMAQPLFVLSVSVTLVLTLSVVVLSAQFPPIVPDIGFEIEGNTALDQGGDFDWENAIPPAIRIPDPNSKIETDPTTFKPDSKFEDPAGWSILPAKVGPGQSELVNFLVWDIQPGALDGGRPSDHWLVLGMERIKTPGFFEMDFEYNQVAWDGSSGGLIRTPGDVLVGFELRGKPTSKMAAYKVLLLQYWPGAQPSLCSTQLGPGGEPESVDVGTDPCPPYGSSGWYYRLLADDGLSAESGLVQATMNTEPFAPPWPAVDGNGNPCAVIGPYQFAEAAINLTALGIEPGCTDPGTVHAKSRSAPHVHSDLKDLVGPVELTKCARLDGHKFEDINGDGIWDQDEPPLEGWEIRLSDGSVTHTDADGYYAFDNLEYGTYTVSEVCPQGEDWVQTAPTPDDPDSCGEAVFTVTLDGCTPEANNLDFGNHWPPDIRLDGHKFEDINGDGLWDQDEPPLEGWEIRLSDGSVTHTDADGYYAFEDLEYGTYTVSEVCPQGEDWVQTAPTPDDPDSCGDAVHTVTLDSCTPEANDLDFGNLLLPPPIRLDGHKFEDINGDGLWDQDEPPLEDWEIRLSDGSVTQTDADGYYAFEDLEYGTYTVSEVCPQGEDWVQTAPIPVDPNSCGEAVFTVTLDSGNPEANDLDFGNYLLPPEIRLDGHKFWDGDEDGIWEQDEEHWPLEGWEIRLSDGSVTHTDADGYYAFDNLEYGTYTVSEVCPPGELWVQTAPELTTEVECGVAYYTVELNSSTPEVNDLDFGNVQPNPPILLVTKDAQTSFTRTYQWTLDKTVDDPGPILLYPGDYANVQYEVVADSTYVDSWIVEGTITIENGGIAPVPLASVTDLITPGDIAVPVECDDWIVEALQTVTCTYGPISLPDGAARTNTVTVTVQDYPYEWTATAPIVFPPDPTEIDEAATVTDTNWVDEQWEGPESFDVGAGDTPWNEIYPWKIWAPGDACGLLDYPNTATLVTNDTNTVLTADANVQILEVCLTLAYEDLPLIIGNDWDYNDLVIQVPIWLDVSDDGDLLAASFEVVQTERSTAFTHAFNLQPYAEYFTCSGQYTKTVTVNGVATTETGLYNPGDSFELIPDTGMPRDLVELTIKFDVTAPGDCPRNFGDPDPINKYHGEWLFFDPWLTVRPHQAFKDYWGIDDYEIHVVDDPPEPRILTVPIAWMPPPEKVPIWDVYCTTVSPTVVEEDGPIFTPYWWAGELCMQ